MLEGGATASAVCRRMHWHQFDVEGEFAPGVVQMRALRGEVTRAAEAILCLKDGSAVPVLLNAAPVRNENEKIVGATVVVQDIARLKELERLREEWASIIAHDLRQPVSAIAIGTAITAPRD